MAKNTHKVIYDLPRPHCLLIGQFMTRWAHLEWRLRVVMYTLMGTGHKIGRLALREPRIVDYLTMIEDIAGLKKVTVSINWAKLKDILKEMEGWRDKFAHGIWLDVEGSDNPVLQLTTGKTVETPGGPAIKSRIKPRGARVSAEQLRNAVAGVDRAVQIVNEMRDEIAEQVEPSPDKSRKQ